MSYCILYLSCIHPVLCLLDGIHVGNSRLHDVCLLG